MLVVPRGVGVSIVDTVGVAVWERDLVKRDLLYTRGEGISVHLPSLDSLVIYSIGYTVLTSFIIC